MEIIKKKELKKFRKKYMQKKGENHFYAKAYDKLIGVSCDPLYCNRSTNSFVIGNKKEIAKNYVSPNLHLGHGSSVILGNSAEYQTDIEQLCRKGKVYQIDMTENSSRFNPFRHYIKRNPERFKEDEKHYKDMEISKLVKCVHDFFHEEESKLSLDNQMYYFHLMRELFSYAACSDKLKDEDRTFRKVVEILKEIDSTTVFEYVGHFYNAQVFSAITAEDFDKVIFAMTTDLSPLAECVCFEEYEETDNVSAENIAGETSYVFIDGDERADLMAALLLMQLHTYCENTSDFKLKKSVHFYVDADREFARHEDYMWFSLRVSRTYGIMFSLMTDNVSGCREPQFDDASLLPETAYYSFDAHLYLSADEKEKQFIISVLKCGKSEISAYDLAKMFSKDKVLFKLNGCVPMVCDRIIPL